MHQVGNEVEQAYRRNDALEERRRLMQVGADVLDKPVAGAEVVPLRRA